MADDLPGPDVAETTVALDDLRTDPAHTSDDGGEPAPVWEQSQYLRELIDRGKAGRDPSADDRELLVRAVLRQVRTLGLYREIVRLLIAPADPGKAKELTLYVLLFPGEGRDNTGIKDLNDKVLGYQLGNEFIRLRQKEIETIFPPPTGPPPAPPWFATVGQDYKTASIISAGMTQKDFAARLVTLDAALRGHLLALLDRAEKATRDRDRLDEIRTLRKTLQRNTKYRFDFLVGVDTLALGRGEAVDLLLRLLTEALKAAGMARFAAKAGRLKTKTARRFAGNRGLDPPPKGHDPRGRIFEIVRFLRVLRAVRDIRDAASAGPGAGPDLLNIFVDLVWTWTFLPYQRLYWANPDVVRDVRKKALVAPKLRQGTTFSFAEVKESLELWLVATNMIDYVKDFLADERTGPLRGQHAEALIVSEVLSQPNARIDWPRLEQVLTRDVQRTAAPLPVLGTTSEYQFYGPVSDHTDRLLFSMDIRDLGLEVISAYELAVKSVDDGQLGEERLVEITLRSSDETVRRRRITYDTTVAVFRKYHRLLSGRPGLHAAAQRAFGGPLDATPLPPFEASVQILLGGDEVFVATHPYFSTVEAQIVKELAEATFAPGLPLDMRTGVVRSSARRVGGARQRRENQTAHDRAFKLSADSPGLLKPLERAHRRIERLIEKLEARPDRAVKGQFYRGSLGSLGLLRLYARGRQGVPLLLSQDVYDRVRRQLRGENVLALLETGPFELVDFQGAVVEVKKLTAQIADLEARVARDVGSDNRHDEVPTFLLNQQMPKWLKKLIDDWADQDKKKKSTKQQSKTAHAA